MVRFSSVVALAWVVSVCPTSSLALSVTFSGSITRVTDESGFLMGAVSIGDPFAGRLFLGSRPPDDDPNSDSGRFQYSPAQSLLEVTTGAGSLVGDALTVLVLNDRDFGLGAGPQDSFSVSARIGLPGLAEPYLLSAGFGDNPDALSSDSVPSQLPPLSAWNSAGFALAPTNPSTQEIVVIRGEITRLNVPEPVPSDLLAASVLCSYAGCRRLTRRCS